RALSAGEIGARAAASGAGKCQTPIVQFDRPAEMEDESQTANVLVRRGVSVAGTTDVTAATVAGGTATGGAACTAGVDYKTTSQLLSYGNGDAEQTMAIEICPDLEYETPQTIKLQLSGPTGSAILGGNSEIFLTINDTATQFTNNHDPINIPAFGATGSPYPSTINVSGAPTVNGGMRVTLYDVELVNPDNVDILLVGPLGQKMVIMGDAGGSTAMSGPVTLTFDDSAGQVLPDSGPLTTGKFEPTTWEPVIAAFPATAPSFPYVVPGSAVGGPPSLGSGFGAGNPNGQWRLFVRDDAGAAFTEMGQPGAIAGGWGLQFVVPTAAGVSVSGRVTTAEGRGIRGAIVTVTGNSLAAPINVMTGVNGKYIVEGLTAGETYIVTIRSRRFVFGTSSRVLTLVDSVTDADFVANP
ncbi:MAG: carboxypeptidase-like regulatory domain-containing protein, partial [Pyrinomonadaceae bacterium]